MYVFVINLITGIFPTDIYFYCNIKYVILSVYSMFSFFPFVAPSSK